MNRPPPPGRPPMTLADLDRLVRGANGDPVVLDAFPTVYYDETGASRDPLGPELPEPSDELVLSLLAERYRGVEFEAADEFPADHRADPEPHFVVLA